MNYRGLHVPVLRFFQWQCHVKKISDMPNYMKTRRRLAASREFRLNARSGACVVCWLVSEIQNGQTLWQENFLHGICSIWEIDMRKISLKWLSKKNSDIDEIILSGSLQQTHFTHICLLHFPSHMVFWHYIYVVFLIT